MVVGMVVIMKVRVAGAFISACYGDGDGHHYDGGGDGDDDDDG